MSHIFVLREYFHLTPTKIVHSEASLYGCVYTGGILVHARIELPRNIQLHSPKFQIVRPHT